MKEFYFNLNNNQTILLLISCNNVNSFDVNKLFSIPESIFTLFITSEFEVAILSNKVTISVLYSTCIHKYSFINIYVTRINLF